MKIVVTGGAGFIGSHLVERLISDEHEVLILDDFSTGRRENIEHIPTNKLHIVVADVRSNTAYQTILSFKPNYIFHLAAQISVRKSVENPREDADVNIIGTINIARAAQEAGVNSIIFSSSGGAIYGDVKTPYPPREDDACKPDSPYGLAKFCAERYLDFYSDHKIRIVHLRYANVYGPRQDPHGEAGVVAIFTKKMLNGEIPTINGDGNQTRDFVYVKDVIRANIAAMLNTEFDGPCNIGTGEESTVNKLYDLISLHSKFGHDPEYGPAKPGEQYRSFLNASLAAYKLDWYPTIDLSDGIESTVKYFRKEKINGKD